MYKLIGVLTMLQREIGEAKEKAEQLMLEGYDCNEAGHWVDSIHDALCDYLDILITAYPEGLEEPEEEPEAGT